MFYVGMPAIGQPSDQPADHPRQQPLVIQRIQRRDVDGINSPLGALNLMSLINQKSSPRPASRPTRRPARMLES